MIIDAQSQFSNAQAITAAAASTNYVDLQKARNIGVGEELFVAVCVTTAFTDTGSDSTLTVALEGDSTSTFTPDGSQQLFIIPALAPVGSVYYARVDPDFAGQYQFLQLKYTPNNGNLTTGAVSAYFVKNIAKFTAFPKGYTIS